MEEKLCLPVLPLRNVVYFPGDCLPIYVGRAKSIFALEDSLSSESKQLVLLAQKDSSNENPAFDDLHDIGVIASIAEPIIKLPEGAIKIVIKVENRAKIEQYVACEGISDKAIVQILHDECNEESRIDIEAYKRSVISCFENYAKLVKKNFHEMQISKISDPGRIADLIVGAMEISMENKQELLEMLDVSKRLMKVFTILEKEIGVLTLEKQIKNRIKDQMDNTHRVYYLNEQLKAIMKELSDNGAENNEYNEIVDLEKQLKELNLSKEAKEKVVSDLKKLKMMPPMSAEATIIRNYVDCILGLPWDKKNKIKTDLLNAQKVLDDNHYGMDKVKERIIEYLAVHKRTKTLRGPILCLVGPPGVGKTSLAESIATATGRAFVRMSLGGVRDEAEIRGHRKTYIGSMPGKIIQSIKKAKSSNPLFLLDEIDKMGSDFRGDPAFALLEVLDSEHNKTFVDHYLEVEYDLSEVMFVTTANSLNMPLPLLDRMEIIKLSGYSEEEKIKIANLHLIDKLKKEHGLQPEEWMISKEALKDLIRRYTRESGVRNLKKELSNLMRKAVRSILSESEQKKVEVTLNNLSKYSGPYKYSFGVSNVKNFVGMVNGLAYTEVGGDLLHIEAVSVPGKGSVKSTGKLGEVMQESVQAAYSYVTSRCIEYGFTSKSYKSQDIHLHVPEGATPKEGPSAGVAMCVCLVSLLSGVPVKASVAMTGEVSLSGRVLEIGGLKEKLLAAVRAGISVVIIPKDNKKDLVEMPLSVKKSLEIIPVENVDEALKIALAYQPVPLEKDERPFIKSDEMYN